MLGRASLVLAAVTALTATAQAQPEPKGPHPRIILDDALRATWKQQAGQNESAVDRAIDRCNYAAEDPGEAKRDSYMGLDWSTILQACLVSYAATGDAKHSRTAIVYFTALLDDLEFVGDGKGGDESARRDSGYAIRGLGVNTAIAYDWLHDAPGMTPELLARARKRWHAWLDWYAEDGYRPHSPGTNYHAAYLTAATLMAIAEGGEGGSAGTALWRRVVDDLWQTDMAAALKPGGVLDGGDWGEGWQYAPLSVAEYALASRALAAAGVKVEGVDRWLEALLHRHVHAALPSGDRTYVGGDTDDEIAYLDINSLSLAAVAVGDAPEEDRAWALAELRRLKVTSRQFPIYDAIAEGRGIPAVEVPRTSWPTWYLATGISQLYARTGWGPDAVWLAARCSRTLDVDHMPPDAGNLVVSRGNDDVLIDPSPYGSLSSLTSNAPTVESGHLPANYKPSQGYWGERTGWRWAHQSTAGVVVARCDYADQYRFQERSSDVPAARRDIVMIPWGKGSDASLVIIDDANSDDDDRGLHLRFRSPGGFALADGVARAVVGGSQLAVRALGTPAGEVRHLDKNDCFQDGVTRGGCDAARVPVGEYRVRLPGPRMHAVHVVDVAAAATRALPAEAIKDGVVLRRGGEAAVIVDGNGHDVSYLGPPGRHVILGGPGGNAGAKVRAASKGSDCEVTVAATGDGVQATYPMTLILDKTCTVTLDPTQRAGTGPLTGEPLLKSPDHGSRGARAGCCGAQSSVSDPALPVALVVIGLMWLHRPRRRA